MEFAGKEHNTSLCISPLAAGAFPRSLTHFQKPCARSWSTITDFLTYYIFDNFLVITAPTSPLHHKLTTLKTDFSELGIYGHIWKYMENTMHVFAPGKHLENITNISWEAILNSLASSPPFVYLTGWNCFRAYHATYQLTSIIGYVNLMLCQSYVNLQLHCWCSCSFYPSYTVLQYPDLLSRNQLLHYCQLLNSSPCSSTSHSHVTMLFKGLHKQEPAIPEIHLPLTSFVSTNSIQAIYLLWLTLPLNPCSCWLFLVSWCALNFAPT